MPPAANQLANSLAQILLEFFTKIIPSLVLSVILFGGGILLLALKIPGWSLFLGLPAAQLGIIFLILTFDKIAQTKIGPDSLHITHCPLCNNPTVAPQWQKEKICEECQKKLTGKLKPKTA